MGVVCGGKLWSTSSMERRGGLSGDCIRAFFWGGDRLRLLGEGERILIGDRLRLLFGGGEGERALIGERLRALCRLSARTFSACHLAFVFCSSRRVNSIRLKEWVKKKERFLFFFVHGYSLCSKRTWFNSDCVVWPKICSNKRFASLTRLLWALRPLTLIDLNL